MIKITISLGLLFGLPLPFQVKFSTFFKILTHKGTIQNLTQGYVTFSLTNFFLATQNLVPSFSQIGLIVASQNLLASTSFNLLKQKIARTTHTHTLDLSPTMKKLGTKNRT
jgi:hypothetical protein